MTDTIKVVIDDDERYPEFYISPEEEGRGRVVEIPRELLDRYVWAQAEYEQVQSEIREYSNLDPEPFNGTID